MPMKSLSYQVINDLIKQSYQRDDAYLIYIKVLTKSACGCHTIYIRALPVNCTKGYIVAVGRFVEEKDFHDLLQAYANQA